MGAFIQVFNISEPSEPDVLFTKIDAEDWSEIIQAVRRYWDSAKEDDIIRHVARIDAVGRHPFQHLVLVTDGQSKRHTHQYLIIISPAEVTDEIDVIT